MDQLKKWDGFMAQIFDKEILLDFLGFFDKENTRINEIKGIQLEFNYHPKTAKWAELNEEDIQTSNELLESSNNISIKNINVNEYKNIDAFFFEEWLKKYKK